MRAGPVPQAHRLDCMVRDPHARPAGVSCARLYHGAQKQQVKGVVPCPRPDPDEKAKIVNELNRKQAMREENKRKRGQPEGLDSADSSMNFSLPPGFSTLAALASGMGDGTGPSGAGIAGAARFSGIGGADTPGRGNATAGRRGGKGSGAKAQSVQSERRAPFDGTRRVPTRPTCIPSPCRHDI